VDGARHTPPPSGQRVLGLPATSPNARLAWIDPLSGVQLSATELAGLALPPLTVSSKNQVGLPARGTANPYGLTLSIDAKGGYFSGAFTLRDPHPAPPARIVERKVNYAGVLIGTRGYGYYLLPALPSTTGATTPIVSGMVILEGIAPPAD
jgi:hypothetical protein